MYGGYIKVEEDEPRNEGFWDVVGDGERVPEEDVRKFLSGMS